MRRLLEEVRAALLLALRAIAARPGMMLLFVVVQCASNLLRFWIGEVEARGHGDSIIVGVGGLFLIARIFVTQWLHVAAARITDDRNATLRRAFEVTTAQAGWFHALVAVSMVTFGLRLWLSQASGGFFSPDGIVNARELVTLLLGLAMTYLAFLPLTPGYFAVLLRHGGEPSLRWSLLAGRRGLLRALVAALVLATPSALLRRSLLVLLGQGGAVAVGAAAVLDGALTVLLMMTATAVYYNFYRRAVAEAPASARALAA